MRPSGRAANQIREVKFTRQYIKHAEGSVLVEFGATKVICNASVVPGVPRFLKGMNQGWLTAEYGMLPRSTHDRMEREAYRGKQSGRTLEIQRLIGRSLRAAVDLKMLGENTIMIDCDVIQADGGTRTASITGATIALIDALTIMKEKKIISNNPFKQLIASISVGIYQGEVIVDLDYAEDSNAETDMNVIMTEDGHFIELQGTAEGHPFSIDELNQMLSYAKGAIEQLLLHQKEALGK